MRSGPFPGSPGGRCDVRGITRQGDDGQAPTRASALTTAAVAPSLKPGRGRTATLLRGLTWAGQRLPRVIRLQHLHSQEDQKRVE